MKWCRVDTRPADCRGSYPTRVERSVRSDAGNPPTDEERDVWGMRGLG